MLCARVCGPHLVCVCVCGVCVCVCVCVTQEEYERGNTVGLDVSTGEPFDPEMSGVFDNYIVKRQVRYDTELVHGHACRSAAWRCRFPCQGQRELLR